MKYIILIVLFIAAFMWLVDLRTIRPESYSILVENFKLIGFHVERVYKTVEFDLSDIIKSSISQIEQDIRLTKTLIKINITDIENLLSKKRYTIDEMVDIRDVYEYLERVNAISKDIGVEATHKYMIKLFWTLTNYYGIILESILFVIKHFIEATAILAVVLADHTVRVFILYYALLYFYSWVGENLLALAISNVRGLTYKTARWESQTLLRGFSQYGIFAFIHMGVFVWGVLRIVLILLGLPHVLDFNLFYVILLLFIFSFWLSIKNMEHTVKYTLALRIDADATLKDTEDGRKWDKVLADNMLSKLYDSVFAPTPFLIRLINFSLSSPLDGLRNIYGYKGVIFFYITLPIFMLVDMFLEGLLQICVWSFLYLYLFPRVRNIRLNAATIELVRGVYNRIYFDIFGETINLNHSYFYTAPRLWGIICGYRTPSSLNRDNPFSNIIRGLKSLGPYPNLRRNVKTKDDVFLDSSSSPEIIFPKKNKISKPSVTRVRKDDELNADSDPEYVLVETEAKPLKDSFILGQRRKIRTIDNILVEQPKPKYVIPFGKKESEKDYFSKEDIELAELIKKDINILVQEGEGPLIIIPRTHENKSQKDSSKIIGVSKLGIKDIPKEKEKQRESFPPVEVISLESSSSDFEVTFIIEPPKKKDEEFFENQKNFRKLTELQAEKLKTLFVPPTFKYVEDAKDDLAAFCYYTHTPFLKVYADIFNKAEGSISRYREWIKTKEKSYEIYMQDPDLKLPELPFLTPVDIEELNVQLWNDSGRHYKIINLRAMRRIAIGEELYEKFLTLLDDYTSGKRSKNNETLDLVGDFIDNYKHTDLHHKASQLGDSWYKLYTNRQMSHAQIKRAIEDYNRQQKERVKLTKYNYSNLQSLNITIKKPEKERLSGLTRIGTCMDNRCAPAKVFRDQKLLSFIRDQHPGEKVVTHDASSVSRDRTLKALEKYSQSSCTFNVNDVQGGLSFKKFLFDYWNWCFSYEEGEKVHVMELDEIELDKHVSPGSRKASPGMKMKKSGYLNKQDRFKEQIEIAKAFRTDVLRHKKVLGHYWAVIPVLKTHKIGDKKVRVALAPESYFHWNQFVLMYNLVELKCSNCNVTDKFCPFFGDFDNDIKYVFKPGYMVESIDLVNMGGRIPPIVKDLFVEWYGEKMERPEDRMLLRYLYNDIFDSQIVMPKALGGDIFEKKSGYNDGPYGTNQFDTVAMKAYQAMCMWDKMVNYNMKLEPFDRMRIRTHGDNDIHGYPRDLQIFSWDVKFLQSKLGQSVKEIVQSDIPSAHEYMGFQVKIVPDLIGDRYVGYRQYGKTIKALCMRDKKYADPIQEVAYLGAIADCLLLTDCWEDRSFRLIQEIRARYQGERFARTADQQEKLTFLARYGADNPRRTYWLESKDDTYEDHYEEVLVFSDEK